jgi:hypothetical protein
MRMLTCISAYKYLKMLTYIPGTENEVFSRDVNKLKEDEEALRKANTLEKSKTGYKMKTVFNQDEELGYGSSGDEEEE